MYVLKNTINIEPLISQWYAWPHLVAPQTLGMNVFMKHIEVMSSFLSAPHLHAQALAATKLKGAPFLDLPANEAYLVEELLRTTKEQSRELIKFAKQYWEFDQLLQDNADGTSLEKFYQELPESLEGMVELVYDTHHRPSIRLIEPLVYKKYYDTSLQSICIGEMDNESRPFTLSTPIFPRENQVVLSIPFSDSRIDALAKARYQPTNLNKLIEQLQIPAEKHELFSSFFIKALPKESYTHKKLEASDIRIRYFSHACVLIETNGESILIDPAINFEQHQSNNYFNFTDLPDRIDYVLLTHNHQDHVLFETLLQLRHRIGAIVTPKPNQGALVDPSLSLILKHIGFKNIIEQGEFDEISLSIGRITSLPFLGEHADLHIYSKLSYHVSLKGQSMLFLADSNNLEPNLYKQIFDYIGSVDTLFIGMECKGAPLSWLYGALYSTRIPKKIDQSRRLSGSDCQKAMDIVRRSGCSKVCVYAMGLEPWLNNIMAVNYTEQSLPIIESNKLLEQCQLEGITAERLFEKREWLISETADCVS